MGNNKNILVCGNGPSCGEIDFKRVPKDSKVMRMTTFYFEEKYYAGTRVDYYVDYARRLVDQYFNIRVVRDKGEYDIDMENTWWTVLREPNPHFPAIKSCTEFIQRVPLIAEFRCFYEYYYGKYLPTGMQAIALAVCLGFENVHLAGFDLFSDPHNLHVYPENKGVKERVRAIQKTSVYDTDAPDFQSPDDILAHVQKTNPISMQMDFLKLLAELYPETKILSVCNSSAINEYIAMAAEICDKPWYNPQNKLEDRTKEWHPLPDTMPSRQNKE